MFNLSKKLISRLSFVVVAVFVLSLCPCTNLTGDNFITASAHDSYDDIKVKINGKKLEFDVKPQLINGRTMVPLRAIFEALGATVNWDDATQTVVFTRNFTAVVMTINSPVMYVNGNAVTLDTPACLVDRRTMVPVRAVSEAFGTKVDWDDATQTVDITFENQDNQDDGSAYNPGTQYEIAAPLSLKEYTSSANEKIKAGIDVIGLVKPDHTLWMWGNNAQKQISSSYGETVHTPTFVMANVNNFEIGKNHVLIHTKDNAVYCQGYDGKFVNDNYEPLLKSVVSIAAGYDHCLALTGDGDLYGWGSNKDRQLSSEETDSIDTPEVVQTNVKEVYANKDYSVILLNDGTLKFMGKISDFKHTSGSVVSPISKGTTNIIEVADVNDVQVWRDAVVTNLSNGKTNFYLRGSNVKQRAEDILNGKNCEWSTDAKAWVEDGNLYAQSGVYYTYKEKKCILDDVAGIQESESGTTIAILNDSSVWIWGSDKNGSLGNGYSNKNSAETPIRLMEPLCPELFSTKTYVDSMTILDVNTGSKDNFNECTLIVEFKNSNGKVTHPIGMVEVEIFEYGTEHNVMKNRTSFFVSESNYKPDYAELKIPYRYIGNIDSGIAHIRLTFTDVNTNLQAEISYVRGFRTGDEVQGKWY